MRRHKYNMRMLAEMVTEETLSYTGKRNPSLTNPQIEQTLDELRGTGWREDADVKDDPAHELAHAMLAPPSRRRLRRFGLGDVGFGDGRKFSQVEEELASLLGILLQKEHGLDWKHTAIYHCWEDSTAKDCEKRLNTLLKRGLIDSRGKPTFCKLSGGS